MKMTDLSLRTLLLNITETGNLFDPATCFVGVATAITDMGAATVIGDVTAAPGAVGTRVAVAAWSDPYKLSDGRWVVDSQAIPFVPADSGDECSVTNWYIATLITAGVLKAWGTIFPAVGLADEFSSLTLIVRVTIDPDGRWSQEVYFNG